MTALFSCIWSSSFSGMLISFVYLSGSRRRQTLWRTAVAFIMLHAYSGAFTRIFPKIGNRFFHTPNARSTVARVTLCAALKAVSAGVLTTCRGGISQFFVGYIESPKITASGNGRCPLSNAWLRELQRKTLASLTLPGHRALT